MESESAWLQGRSGRSPETGRRRSDWRWLQTPAAGKRSYHSSPGRLITQTATINQGN